MTDQSPTVALDRIVQKVQQTPQGELMIQNAFQACVIEDQQKAIEELQDELLGRQEKKGSEDS